MFKKALIATALIVTASAQADGTVEKTHEFKFSGHVDEVCGF